MFFATRRNYNKIIGEVPNEETCTLDNSYPSSSNFSENKQFFQSNLDSNLKLEKNYIDNEAPPNFHHGIDVTVSTGKNTILNRSKQQHRWDHHHIFEDLDQDAIIPFTQVHFNLLTIFSLLLAVVFWLIHLIRSIYRLLQLWEIKAFFTQMLEISDTELSNILWQDVVLRLCKLQPELHLIISQERITPLDVYQRILRHKNYFTALVYDNILPQKILLPLFGSVYYLSTGLKFNIEWLLFWGPWALWKGSYALKEEYKNIENLDNHELESRLNKSYRYSVQYMEQFISPANEIIAKTITFTCGSIFAVLLILSAWDEDVEHILTIMTVCGAIIMVCRSFIANENMVFCQEFLMKQIIANVHYAPKTWLKQAHSTEVYKDFAQIFQLKAQYLAEELFSPIITPFVFVRPNSYEIVEFFYKKTQTLDGLGDICSYSLMDISRYGDKRLMMLNQSFGEEELQNPFSVQAKEHQGGKIELSLINFALNNPTWKAPKTGMDFIYKLKEKIYEEAEYNNYVSSKDGLKGVEDSAYSLTHKKELGLKSEYSKIVNDSYKQDSFNKNIMDSQNQSIFLKEMPFDTIEQPKHVHDHSSRTMEMSFNAFFLNKLLASSFHSNLFYNNSTLTQNPTSLLHTNRFGGYGSLEADITIPQKYNASNLNPKTMEYEKHKSINSSNLFDVPDDEEDFPIPVLQGYGLQLSSFSKK